MAVWRFTSSKKPIKKLHVLFPKGSCWLDCIIGCVMSAPATSQNASCHQIPLFPWCTLRSPLFNKRRRAPQTDGDKAGNVKRVNSLSLSLSVVAGAALHTDKGAMCWNVASFHYIKTWACWRVSLCFFLFFPYSINGPCHVMFSIPRPDIETLIRLTCSYYHARTRRL